MLNIDKKIFMFNIREVHFSEYPFDMDDCDFLKFCYCKNKVDVEGFTRKEQYTMIIDLTQDLDTIFNNMKKEVRKKIHKAQRSGVIIQKNEDFDKFFKIYRQFIQKKGIKSLFDIFGVGSSSIESMERNGTLFVAKYNDELLIGTLCLEDGSHIEAWLTGSTRFNSVDGNKKKIISCADRLIDWEIIKYAKEKGISEFDLGGMWSEKEAAKDKVKQGINDFKLRSGGEVVTRYSYQKIYSRSFSILNYFYNFKNLGR